MFGGGGGYRRASLPACQGLARTDHGSVIVLTVRFPPIRGNRECLGGVDPYTLTTLIRVLRKGAAHTPSHSLCSGIIMAPYVTTLALGQCQGSPQSEAEWKDRCATGAGAVEDPRRAELLGCNCLIHVDVNIADL